MGDAEAVRLGRLLNLISVVASVYNLTLGSVLLYVAGDVTALAIGVLGTLLFLLFYLGTLKLEKRLQALSPGLKPKVYLATLLTLALCGASGLTLLVADALAGTVQILAVLARFY